ncbi:hypothetical protein [Marinomonas rhodophyticola]|uniref:Uncharacterized protein n=1 Tax=Marinomonas rhodophyticola TaxID=2992803 RepID=A0ABT3KCA2_9GAMM|nr:hypothetical protein [Marinomonas sp. KJ51-3]MCW4628169.1 hypothetical protein [Marinomonas sp. KJ51-3]
MTTTETTIELAAELKAIVGSQYTLTDEDKTKPYSQGIRLGGGKAYAVVRLVAWLRSGSVCKPA